MLRFVDGNKYTGVWDVTAFVIVSRENSSQQWREKDSEEDRNKLRYLRQLPKVS